MLRRMRTFRLLLVLVCGLAASPRMQARGDAPDSGPRFPASVTTIGGEKLDVAALARRRSLVIVTLKATWCQVCQTQLLRLKRRLPEIKPCGATFLVLAPGPRSELRSIQQRIDFPYPFVEDVGLSIAKRLGLQMSKTEILPSLLILGPDLSIQWMQRGRGPGSYADGALVEALDCGNSI